MFQIEIVGNEMDTNDIRYWISHQSKTINSISNFTQNFTNFLLDHLGFY